METMASHQVIQLLSYVAKRLATRVPGRLRNKALLSLRELDALERDVNLMRRYDAVPELRRLTLGQFAVEIGGLADAREYANALKQVQLFVRLLRDGAAPEGGRLLEDEPVPLIILAREPRLEAGGLEGESSQDPEDDDIPPTRR